MDNQDGSGATLAPTRDVGERGFTILQLVVTVAIIAIVSAFAIIRTRQGGDDLRRQNSARLLASYFEKARLDAIRRHSTSSVQLNADATTYSVTMDFDGTGSTTTTRTFPLESGVRFATVVPATVTFDWRGRTIGCPQTFTLENGRQSWIDVGKSGDVTVDSDISSDDLPTLTYAGVSPTPDIATNTVVSGGTVRDNSSDCSTVASGGTAPPISSGPPACQIGANTSSITIRKNGGTGSVTITLSSVATVTASGPSNLQITPVSQTASSGGVSYTIKSMNASRGTFSVTFTSACGSSLSVVVKVTN